MAYPDSLATTETINVLKEYIAHAYAQNDVGFGTATLAILLIAALSLIGWNAYQDRRLRKQESKDRAAERAEDRVEARKDRELLNSGRTDGRKEVINLLKSNNAALHASFKEAFASLGSRIDEVESDIDALRDERGGGDTPAPGLRKRR